MVNLDNVNRCKDCGRYPDIIEFDGWIKLKCKCGRSSSSHNILQSKKDWNYYHGEYKNYDNIIALEFIEYIDNNYISLDTMTLKEVCDKFIEYRKANKND